MKLLKGFIHSFESVKMKPALGVIREPLPKDARCQVLAEPGRQYAAYFKGAPKFAFTLDVPAGDYEVRWLDVVTGRSEASPKMTHAGGAARFQIPDGLDECASKAAFGFTALP